MQIEMADRNVLFKVVEHQTQDDGNFMMLSTFPQNLIYIYSEMAQQ